MTTTYRPENVRVEHHPEGGQYGPRFPYLVLDHDGTPPPVAPHGLGR